MISLAFKDAKLAGGLFSQQIQFVTGGKFSHVELWLSGPQNAAWCYSSREPHGTFFVTLDLTAPGLWTIVPIEGVTAAQEEEIIWFCRGSAGRDYDGLGILGIGSGLGLHDSSDRFCSEEVVNVLQECLGKFLDVKRWLVAPSGVLSGDRYGLYELMTGKIVPATLLGIPQLADIASARPMLDRKHFE